MASRASNHVHTLFRWLNHWVSPLVSSPEQVLRHLTPPARPSLMLRSAADLTRRNADLIAENAFLRQQRSVLDRQGKSLPVRNPLAAGSSSAPVG